MTARPEPSASAARILIVDDEPDNRELMQLILNWEGFATVMASSGEEALVIARDEPVDLVLLDLMMPGLDGFEVTTRMKRSLVTRRIPIVVLSALDDHAAKERFLDAGAAEFASKPIDRSDAADSGDTTLHFRSARLRLERARANGSRDLGGCA